MVESTLDSQASIKFISQDPSQSSYTKRLDESEWEELKPMLFVLHGQRQTREFMVSAIRRYGVVATVSQLTTRVSKWGFRVYKKVKEQASASEPHPSSSILKHQSVTTIDGVPILEWQALYSVSIFQIPELAAYAEKAQRCSLRPDEMYRLNDTARLLCTLSAFREAFEIFYVVLECYLGSMAVNFGAHVHQLVLAALNCACTAHTPAHAVLIESILQLILARLREEATIPEVHNSLFTIYIQKLERQLSRLRQPTISYDQTGNAYYWSVCGPASRVPPSTEQCPLLRSPPMMMSQNCAIHQHMHRCEELPGNLTFVTISLADYLEKNGRLIDDFAMQSDVGADSVGINPRVAHQISRFVLEGYSQTAHPTYVQWQLHDLHPGLPCSDLGFIFAIIPFIVVDWLHKDCLPHYTLYSGFLFGVEQLSVYLILAIQVMTEWLGDSNTKQCDLILDIYYGQWREILRIEGQDTKPDLEQWSAGRLLADGRQGLGLISINKVISSASMLWARKSGATIDSCTFDQSLRPILRPIPRGPLEENIEQHDDFWDPEEQEIGDTLCENAMFGLDTAKFSEAPFLGSPPFTGIVDHLSTSPTSVRGINRFLNAVMHNDEGLTVDERIPRLTLTETIAPSYQSSNSSSFRHFTTRTKRSIQSSTRSQMSDSSEKPSSHHSWRFSVNTGFSSGPSAHQSIASDVTMGG